MWQWLGDNHDQLEALGSIIIGLASAAIARVAYVRTTHGGCHS